MDKYSEELKDRVVGCFLGGAIGDALGYQCEFEHNLKEREYTTYKDDYGIFSDDTQMTLFTANALLWEKTRIVLKEMPPTTIACIHRAYRDWYFTQNNVQPDQQNVSWIDKLAFIRRRRNPGFTCLNALTNINAKEYGTIKDPVNQSKGCGGAMRVTPIGLYANSLKEAVELSAKSAAITHGHPLGIIPAAFVGGLIYEIAHDNTHNFNEQLHLSFVFTKQFATQYFYHQYQDTFMAIMRKAFELSQNNARDLDNIKQLGSGWTAEEAVAIAIYSCIRHADNFEDAVVASINHDGDSDSTGSIAGGIMGALLGIKAIPQYYVNNIEHSDFLLDFANDFATCQSDKISNLPETDPWFTKYTECKPAQEYN
jgi:ADP-ribosylglycohydrolase